MAVLHTHAGVLPTLTLGGFSKEHDQDDLTFSLCDVSSWTFLLPHPRKKMTKGTPYIAPTSGRTRTLYTSPCVAADSSHPEWNLPDSICPGWHYTEAIAGGFWMIVFCCVLFHSQSRVPASFRTKDAGFLPPLYIWIMGRNEFWKDEQWPPFHHDLLCFGHRTLAFDVQGIRHWHLICPYGAYLLTDF